MNEVLIITKLLKKFYEKGLQIKNLVYNRTCDLIRGVKMNLKKIRFYAQGGAKLIKRIDNRLLLLIGAAFLSLCVIGAVCYNIAAKAGDYTSCYSIMADGEAVVSLATREQAESAAERFTKGVAEGDDVIYINFTIEPDSEPIDFIATVGEAVEVLSESEKIVVTYKVENVTEIDIPYAKTVIEDDTLLAGNTIVEQEGVVGKCIRTAVSYYENGIETASLAPFAEVAAVPVEEIVRVGTLKLEGLPDGGIECPVKGTFTSSFGERWGRNHTGLDIGAPVGEDVYAPVSGVVIFAGEKNGYGNYIKIDHGNGVVTAYAHLSVMFVKEGDVVKEGSVIGEVGTTGNVTGPHLHFEIIKNGEFLDPEPFIAQ